MTSAVADDSPPPPDRTSDGGGIHLGWVVAGLCAAAGVVHFAMVPVHGGGELVDPVGFAVAGWFQLTIAGLILAGRDGRRTYQAAVVGNLLLVGLWVWSRTVGLPVGTHSGTVEEAGTIDTVTVALELAAVVVAARILMATGRVAAGRLAPALAGVGALGLASVLIVSPDAADHGGSGHSHDHGGETAAGHHGADADAHAELMAQIDADRCDLSFNHRSYWDETETLGVDTYQGGAMSTSDAGHHGGGDATVTLPEDPFDGRGSAELDELVALTDASSGGELAAAQLVAALGEADEETYDAWVAVQARANAGGGHGDHGSSGDGEAEHHNHAGPQPWVAMTDPDQCATLADELAQARDVALRHPTVADAQEAGYRMVAPYLPGIASHFMNFSYVDGEFDIEHPEMILFDGNGPDARVVGLSYYIFHDGDTQPTQGFTGDNDHYHRHLGLCMAGGQVIGDSATTDEECEARGGVKSGGSSGWMSHAWVVPGCESPWGVFSASSPTLDGALGDASGDGGPGCAESGVRDRYSLGDPPPATDVPEAAPARAGG